MRKCAVVSLLFVLAACGSSTEPEPIWGTYNLQTVEGQPLPYVLIQDEAGMLDITAGYMWLSSDMTFSRALTFRATVDGVVTTYTEYRTGTFRVSGSSLTLWPAIGIGSVTGSFVDRTLAITYQGTLYVYVFSADLAVFFVKP